MRRPEQFCKLDRDVNLDRFEPRILNSVFMHIFWSVSGHEFSVYIERNMLRMTSEVILQLFCYLSIRETIAGYDLLVPKIISSHIPNVFWIYIVKSPQSEEKFYSFYAFYESHSIYCFCNILLILPGPIHSAILLCSFPSLIMWSPGLYSVKFFFNKCTDVYHKPYLLFLYQL